MWIGQGESSSFWMGILTDLKARGVEDVLITITDNLNDFTYIIKTVFPHSTSRYVLCIRYAIPASMWFWTDMKDVTADMREIYTSVNREQAVSALSHFEQKWGSKYRHAVQSWHRN